MHVSRSLVLCAAVAFISAGCEVHEHERGGEQVGVTADVGVDDNAGPLFSDPGVVAVDTDPDPAQRVYVYDEGFPPGTYLYDNYYYYGGYRYPRDVFVNRYVQENIRQHRYVNTDDNRRQGQSIEQRQKADFATNHGVRKNRPAQRADQPREQGQAHQPQNPGVNNERPENRAATPENRAATPENRQPDVRQPDNRTPANTEEHRAPAARPEDHATPNADEHRAPAAQPENHPAPNAEEHRAPAGQPENRTNDAQRQNTERPENRPDASGDHKPADEPKHDDTK